MKAPRPVACELLLPGIFEFLQDASEKILVPVSKRSEEIEHPKAGKEQLDVFVIFPIKAS